MAFDKVFQGPPLDVAAPGTILSPSFGIDVTNKELYVSAGDGWEEIAGGGDSGTSLDIQGHASIGVGSAVTDNTVLGVSETTTTAPDFTGIRNIITADPTVVVTDGNGYESFYTELDINIDNLPGGDTGNLVFTASDHELLNHSNTNKATSALTAGYYYFGNEGNGGVAQVNVVECDGDNEGTGTIDTFNNIYIDPTGNEGGGVITNLIGLHVDDQTAGVNNFAIKTGAGLVEFGDNVKCDKLLESGTIYTAAGIPIPLAAIGFKGSRAFVGDSTAAAVGGFGAAYVPGGTHIVPVWCDGTSWLIG